MYNVGRDVLNICLELYAVRKVFIEAFLQERMAASTWVIIGIIVVIVFIVVKLASKKQEVAVKLVLILFFFFMLTAGYVYAAYDIEITSLDGLLKAGTLYFSWLRTVGHNVADISSYAISHEWSLRVPAANETLEG